MDFSKDIKYVGVNDHEIDSVDEHFADEFCK